MNPQLRLEDIYESFPTDQRCIAFLEVIRWGQAPKCAYCDGIRTTKLQKENRYRCNRCNVGFSVTVGTVFHHTHLPLQKWLYALYIILTSYKGITVRQLAQAIQVNKNTANFIIQRVDQALLKETQRELINRIVTNTIEIADLEESNSKMKGDHNA